MVLFYPQRLHLCLIISDNHIITTESGIFNIYFPLYAILIFGEFKLFHYILGWLTYPKNSRYKKCDTYTLKSSVTWPQLKYSILLYGVFKWRFIKCITYYKL